ncbi:MAG: C10 family peptidase [Alistipes sp.]|nr:C10 family peptidase [Alistipes sp.]
MKRFCIFASVVLFAAISCQKEVVEETNYYEPVSLEAEHSNYRTYDEALNIAKEALSMLDTSEEYIMPKRKIKLEDSQIVKRPITRGETTEDIPVMYVFNNENDEGFTIIAADKSKDAVIAVTEKGNYTYGEPTGVVPFDKLMDNVVQSRIIITPPIILEPTPGCIIDTVYYRVNRVDPLLTTKWGQQGIYGKYCLPNHIAGCVNIALTQIMAKHQWPETIQYTFRGDNTQTAIPWDGILEHTLGYGSVVNDDYICNCGCSYNDLALLIREVGERTHTEYEDNESGAYSSDAYSTIVSLGFANADYVFDVNLDSFIDKIIQNLDRGRPVYIAGQNETENTGHAWVIDGYDFFEYKINYFFAVPGAENNRPYPGYELGDVMTYSGRRMWHCNWGWSGRYDGWFNHNCFDPYNPESDDSANTRAAYTDQFKLIYNIYPYPLF